jgi:hypothetical protein
MLQFWLLANTVLWSLNVKLGNFTLNLNVIVLLSAGAIWLLRKPKIALSSARVLILLLAYLSFSMLIAISSPCNDKLQKSAVTAPILVLLVFIGWEAGRRSLIGDWLNLQKAALFSLLVALAGFIAEASIPSWFISKQDYRAHGKYSGLFQEPSHVAFSLFPCIAILLIAENRTSRRRGILALVTLLIVSRSSTLIALTAAWFLYRLVVQRKLRQAVLLGVGVALGIGLGATDYEGFLGPTIVRITGVMASSDTDNLSSLVYVQGWQDTWANFTRTRGLGLGFNMMGCHPLLNVAAREVLAFTGNEELNAEDGSFQFAKIVSEAGVAGIAFYAVIVWWWVRLERRIREIKDHKQKAAVSTQAALMFCFIASSFIRGGSYFSGGLLLWVVAVSGASKWQQSSTKQTIGDQDVSIAYLIDGARVT